MRQGTFNYGQPTRELKSINLDEINDPYEKSKERYFVFEIVNAKYFQHKKLGGAAYITIGLTLVEECGSADKIENSGNFKFKVEKLFQSLSLDKNRIWKLKNLCNALKISGKHSLESLAKLLPGNRIKVKVMARYNKKVDGYFYVITRFKGIDE